MNAWSWGCVLDVVGMGYWKVMFWRRLYSIWVRPHCRAWMTWVRLLAFYCCWRLSLDPVLMIQSWVDWLPPRDVAFHCLHELEALFRRRCHYSAGSDHRLAALELGSSRLSRILYCCEELLTQGIGWCCESFLQGLHSLWRIYGTCTVHKMEESSEWFLVKILHCIDSLTYWHVPWAVVRFQNEVQEDWRSNCWQAPKAD